MRNTYTKDQLAAAVAGARSWRQVNTYLGRAPEAASTNLKRLAAEFGIDVTRLGGGTKRTYTDDQLRAAVTQCTTWAEVATALGKNPRSGASRRIMRQVADRLGLDVSHLEKRSAAGEKEEAAGVEPAAVSPAPR